MSSDQEKLPAGWSSLWRAHVSLPEAVTRTEFTIYVRAGGRDAAHLAIRRALHSMFPAAAPDLDEAYCNLSSARDLVAEGVSERHVDRLFEAGWTGEMVEDWVRAPVFLVPDAAALYAAWMTAQLDHSSHYASLAFVPKAGKTLDPIPYGVAAQTGQAEAAQSVAPIRYHSGFLIAGERLVIKVHPSAGRDQISIGISATAEAIGGDRGVQLGLAERQDFEPDDIRVEGDVLACAAQSPYMAEYGQGVTDYREGFTVTLEPGQGDAVRQAVAQLRRMLAAYRAAADHLQPWLRSVQLSPRYVEEPVFHLVVARVLDGADQAAALAAFDNAAHTLPTDARSRVEDPALWTALDDAVNHTGDASQ